MILEHFLHSAVPLCGGDRIQGTVRIEGNRAFLLNHTYTVQVVPPNQPAGFDAGVEDHGYQEDGYLAANYGWEEALERYAEQLPEWVEVDPASIRRIPVAVIVGPTGAYCPNCGILVYDQDIQHNSKRQCYWCAQLLTWPYGKEDEPCGE